MPILALVKVPALEGVEGWAWPTLCLTNRVRGRAPDQSFMQFGLDHSTLLPPAPVSPPPQSLLRACFWADSREAEFERVGIPVQVVKGPF